MPMKKGSSGAVKGRQKPKKKQRKVRVPSVSKQAEASCPPGYGLDSVQKTNRKDTMTAVCGYKKKNPFDNLKGMNQDKAVAIIEEGGEFSCTRIDNKTLCSDDKGWEVVLKHAKAPFNTPRFQKQIKKPVTSVMINRIKNFRIKGGK